jgi:hypothetical protein
MCRFCARVDSIIEAAGEHKFTRRLESSLFDLDLPADDPEMNDIILNDDRNVWMNVIALITATWCLKKKIPIFPLQ